MRHFLAAVFIVTAFSVANGAEPGAQKKLIEFGWDEPDTAFLRAHVDEMERTPFDGCVFHVDTTDEGGKPVSFTWTSWSRKAFKREQLEKSLDDLKATRFKHFTSNFLRFNTSPADLDWFDDHAAIVNNAKLAAAFAREAGCAGILFDTEQYNAKLFNYPSQRDAKTKSWDQYAAQVRLRGREVMEGFQAGNPDVTLFLTFGYTLPWRQCRGDRANLAKAQYGLLAPFLDGMLDAAKGNSRIIDGYESSYGFKQASQFESAYQTMKAGVLPLVADPEKYKSHFRFGFGIWLDRNWRTVGWSTDDPQKNFFLPEVFERSVKSALDRTDEYVWIYSETPKWWTPQGTPDKLPKSYEAALRHASGR